MVLVHQNITSKSARLLKCAYFKRLINAVLPNSAQVSIDYGLLNAVTRLNKTYSPPKDHSWALQDESITTADITKDFGDYQPRWWGTDEKWQLTLPTPVGNVNLYFEQKLLNATMPKLLEGVIYNHLNNPDLFVTSVLSQRGGAMDDTTLGRSIEHIVLKDANEWFFRLLVIGSGLATIAYLAMK